MFRVFVSVRSGHGRWCWTWSQENDHTMQSTSGRRRVFCRRGTAVKIQVNKHTQLNNYRAFIPIAGGPMSHSGWSEVDLLFQWEWLIRAHCFSGEMNLSTHSDSRNCSFRRDLHPVGNAGPLSYLIERMVHLVHISHNFFPLLPYISLHLFNTVSLPHSEVFINNKLSKCRGLTDTAVFI